MDPVGRKVYWTDIAEVYRGIRRANLGGGNIEELVTTGLTTPRAIALDAAARKMYWTDAKERSSERT